MSATGSDPGATGSQHSPPPSGPSSGPPNGPAPSFLRLFPSIMLPMFLALVDQTIVATALPAIAGDLGGVERISWVVIAYLIAATIAAPVYGRLGDLLGRKRLLLAGLAVFISASFVCAFATSLTMLIIGRILQGLGGGGLMTMSQALVGETVPPRDRARYQGYLAAVGVTSHTFGPVAGGFLTEHFGWRSIFLINIPVGILAAVLTLRLAHRPGAGEKFRFDGFGFVFLALFIACALLMLQQAQQLKWENGVLAVGLLAMATASLALLILTERRVRTPLLPVQLMRLPAIWRTDAVAGCHGAILVSLLTFVPIYMRVVHGASAAEMGLLLLPMTVSIGVGSLITGRLVSRTGRTTLMPSIGLAVVTVSLVVLALASPVLSARQVSWLLAFNALFLGTVMSVVQVVVQTTAGPLMLGAAAASVQLSRSLGAALGTALVAAVLFATLRAADHEAAGLLGSVLQNGPGVLDSLSAARRLIVETQFASAFRSAFLVAAAFAALGCVLTWTIPLRRI